MRDRDFEGSVCSGTTYTGGALHGWRVAERWGGLAGAVATVGADGRYRHMTFLEGFIGSESIHLFPTMDWALHDGGGRAWFVETATERWMPSPVYNMGWVTSWRLLPCDLPRLAMRVSQVNSDRSRAVRPSANGPFRA